MYEVEDGECTQQIKKERLLEDLAKSGMISKNKRYKGTWTELEDEIERLEKENKALKDLLLIFLNQSKD